jgi:CDP-diacylglycerol--serine O-phosphatidyltransferase
MDLRKTFFLLPNLFTLSSVFCGFFAITLCAGHPGIEQLYQAALAICFGFFFDTFDGRVARLTKTQTALGRELDSLADVITFGAAPAMLVYKFGLQSFGLWGVVVAFLFVAAGAIRLARFNILAAQHDGPPGKYILGLPIPAAAGVLVSLVIVHHNVGGERVYAQSGIAALVLVLAYLMISRIRFRSFKDLRLTRKTLGALFLIVAGSLLIAFKLRTSFIFVTLMSAYLTLGLTEEVLLYAAERRRRRREARVAAGEKPAPEDEEQTIEDAEVIRALTGDPADSSPGPDSAASTTNTRR